MWKSSVESFMFSLKDHAGVGPVKMPVRSDKTGWTVLQNSSIGLSFGSSFDLCVLLNAIANANTKSLCNVGNAYQLPSSTSVPHFLE